LDLGLLAESGWRAASDSGFGRLADAALEADKKSADPVLAASELGESETGLVEVRTGVASLIGKWVVGTD
jgi:hypothetical protein